MLLTNYVLTFINNDGETVLCKNDGTQCDISEKPFYKSRDNAEKAISKINLSIKRANSSHRKHWYDKAKNGELNIQSLGEHSQAMRFINDFENGELILENGLQVREVNISIELGD